MLKCSPKKESNKLTCFTKNNLINLIKNYNKNNNNNKIIISSKNKKDLWNELNIKLSSNCKNEWCWIYKLVDNNPLKNKLLSNFRPKMPDEWHKNKYTWLSTTDIYNVMKQYEEKYKNFFFFGPFPVDCPNGYLCELSNLSLKNLIKSKKYKIGIIFNLDKHYESGSHWVALYINININNISTIEYFDSYGIKPPKLIKKFMNSLIDKFIKLNLEALLIYNDKRHQYGNSECGIYSIYYILKRLDNKSYYSLTKKIIEDKLMNDMRNYLYRKY